MRKWALLVLALVLWPVAGAAQEIPDPQDGSYVHDFAEMVSAEVEDTIETKLGDLEDQDSTELAVVTVESLDGYAIEEYSIALAREWGVGQEETDNGAVLLIAESDRQMRIEVGFGLEGTLTDAESKLIIENEITPRFRDGDFDGGITAGVDAMIAAVRGEFSGDDGGDGDGSAAWLLWLFLGVIGIFGLGMLFLGTPSDDDSYGGGFFSGGYSSGGFSSGSSSGGGFSGGGFGGGGASGGW